MSTFYKEIQTKEKQTRVSVNACFLQRNPNKRKKILYKRLRALFTKKSKLKKKKTHISVYERFLQRNPNKRKKTCISVYVCFLQRNPMKEKNLYECLQALNNVLCVTLVRATWSILSQRRSPYAGTCQC